MVSPEVTQWTLLSYPGISAAVVMLVGGLKKLFPAWIGGKEPHIALALSAALGVAAKLTIPGAYEAVLWVPHLVALLAVAFGAKVGHDWIVNELVKGKENKP